MNLKTIIAIGEMIQAAAHQHGVVGPVQFTICPVHPSERESDSKMSLPIENLPDPTAEHSITDRILSRAIRRTPGTPGISDKTGETSFLN